MTFKNTRFLYLRFFFAITSLLLSAIFSGFDDLLNRDGYLYLFTADQFVSGGLSAAMETYNWPFLSILIAAVHAATGLSMEVSGRVLVTVILTWLIDTLICISYQFKKDVRIAFAVGVVLLCSPFINEYRSELIRDPFAWALIFYGLYSLFCYMQSGTIVSSCMAQASFMLAVLFRVEAIIFLLLPTISIWFNKDLRTFNASELLRVNCVFGVCAITGTVLLAVFSKEFLSSGKLIQQIHQYLSADFVFGNIARHLHFLQGDFLPPWSEDYAFWFLVFGLLSVLVAKVISGFNVVYFVLFTFLLIKNRLCVSRSHKMTLLMVCVLSLIPIAWFMLNQLFISSRYAGVVILAGFLVFGLVYGQALIAKPASKMIKVISVFLCLLLVRELAGIDQDKINYVYAGNWVKENIDEKCRFVASDARISYLAGRGYFLGNASVFDDSESVDSKLCSVVVVVEGDELLLDYVSSHAEKPVQSFDGGRRKVDIYTINRS